jgi:hypothetical protein
VHSRGVPLLAQIEVLFELALVVHVGNWYKKVLVTTPKRGLSFVWAKTHSRRQKKKRRAKHEKNIFMAKYLSEV